MNALKVGELFAGYGGIGLGLAQVLDTETVWVSDIDKGANKILDHRFPGIPNHGDLTQIDWTTVEPVDIITGGFPCQDLSHAGKRAGLADGTRSGLWSYMCEAINVIRPRLVVAENVRGLLSAEALRPVESCTFCVGDEPNLDLRALGAVLADLADIGYDTQWFGLHAGLPERPIDNITHVGACHGRFRVFLIAHPQGERPGIGVESFVGGLSTTVGRSGARADLNLLPTPRAGDGDKGGPNRRGSSGDFMLPSAVVQLLPTPTVQDGSNTGGASQFDRNSIPLNALVTLLPTPAVNDMGKAYTPDEWDAWTAKMKAAHGNGNGHGKSLEIEAARLLPTPTAKDSAASGGAIGSANVTLTDATQRAEIRGIDFGDYAPAIARWETVLGRPSPPPTEPTGKNGAHRLSARFAEFMMGLPDGWVTDVPGITRNEALKACGNGVVPQQCAAAIRHMLAAIEAEVAA